MKELIFKLLHDGVFAQYNHEDQEYQLDGQEAIHCITVLRKNLGDQIELINGKGFWLKENVEFTKKGAKFKLTEFAKIISKHTLYSPTKNSDEIEWLFEKQVN